MWTSLVKGCLDLDTGKAVNLRDGDMLAEVYTPCPLCLPALGQVVRAGSSPFPTSTPLAWWWHSCAAVAVVTRYLDSPHPFGGSQTGPRAGTGSA